MDGKGKSDKSWDKAEALKSKIKKLLEIPGEFELLSFRKGDVFFEEKWISHFTFDELEDAVRTISSKRKRKIAEDFIKYISEKKSIFKSRPEYVNIKFRVENRDKIVDFLKRKKYPSFRAFIIENIAKEFQVDWKGKFSVSTSKEPSAGQVLIPYELFEMIRHKIEKITGKVAEKRYVRKEIARRIEEILRKIR